MQLAQLRVLRETDPFSTLESRTRRLVDGLVSIIRDRGLAKKRLNDGRAQNISHRLQLVARTQRAAPGQNHDLLALVEDRRGALEMLAYGILLSAFAVLGGYVARWLDAGLGPKFALRIEIVMSMLGLTAMLGMRPDLILFFWPHDPAAPPLWSGPVFRTLPDVIFELVGFLNAVFITAQYASSRTLLTRLTPPERTGAFFGVSRVTSIEAISWIVASRFIVGRSGLKGRSGSRASISRRRGAGFANGTAGSLSPGAMRVP